MRYVCTPAAVLVALLSPSLILAQNGTGLSIENYQFVSESRLTRTQWYTTYKADLVNTGPARTGVVATLSSTSPNVQIVNGQNTLHFSAVPANGRVTSSDTFTVLMDRSVVTDVGPFLQWTFVTPVANPGPDQTVAVGSTVILNGSGSSNPSGIGTLSYSWAFASKPAGSAAILLTPKNVSTSFVVDVPGNYVVNLTVDNGSAQDTRSVKISTTNSPPVANAGPNQSVATGSVVQLNGTGSYDVDGDPLSYTWTFISVPNGSDAVRNGIGSFRSPIATFTPDLPGTYIVQLAVSDGKVERTATTTVTAGGAGNTPPVANAGPNQSNIPIGATVQLDGSASTDVNGDPLTYKWSLITAPSGSTAQINNPTAVKPIFVADKAGTYVAQLIVNDGKVDSAASTVTITTVAAPPPPVGAPTANAGPNQTVGHGTTVQLSGSGSDPQNLALTYSWSFNSKPAGSSAALSSNTIANPTFLADKPGQYVLQLMVNNGQTSSQPSVVTITTTNTAPVANPGANQNGSIGAVVNLNGGGSTDADNDPLTYAWSFTARPTGSSASLSAANSKTPTFVPDLPGTYVVQLIVSDPYTASDPRTVTITVTGASTDIQVPANITVPPGQYVPFPITLTKPADADVDLIVKSNDTTVAVLNTGIVTIRQGQTDPLRQPLLTGVANGATTITVSAPNRSPATSNVTVGLGSINLAITNQSLYLWKPQTLTVTLSQPAPAGGKTVTLSYDSRYLTITPNVLNFVQGQTQATAQVTGVQVGNPTISASASGYTAATPLTVNVGATIAWVTSSATFPSGTTPQFVNLILYSTVPGNTNFDPNDGIVVQLSSSRPDVANFLHPTMMFLWDASTEPQLRIPIDVFGPGTTILTAKGTNLPEVSMTVNITGPLAITSAALPQGTAGAGYNFTVQAAGGTQPYQWSATGLPANLAINGATGQITGTPATDGTFPNVKITVSDASNPKLTSTATYTLTVVKQSATSIAVSSGSGQSAAINTAFAQPLKAIVKDANGNPVSGTTVTFTPPSSGASGTFAGGVNTAVTDANGIASSAIFTANASSGTYNVVASAGNLSTNFTLTNTSGGVSSVTVSSGSGQNAKINTAFALPLKVLVKDSGGNPVSGTTVTFTPPSSGASGTFAGGVNTAVTDAGGIAASAAFTANGTAGSYTVVASTANGSANFSLTNTLGDPASIIVSGGSGQNARINTPFALLLKVTVKDAGGNALSGLTVTFTAPVSGASGTFAGGVNTAVTDANGVATSAAFTANGTTGGYNVIASLPGLAQTAALALTNTAGDVSTVTVSSGSGQSAKINTTFAQPLKVLVKDTGNNPLSGVTVTFTAPSSGASGTFGNTNQITTTAVTDASGIATTASFKANSIAGANYTVVASVGNTLANFSLTNTAGDPASISVASGSPQSAQNGIAFSSPLRAVVKDAGDNPLSNVTVTFTAPSSGASGTFANGQTTTSAATDANGVATSTTFTANATAGSYNVAATVPGVAQPANFSLTNSVGSPGSITVGGGSPQSTKINTAFATPLKVVVKDAGNNLLPNVTVTFTVPSSGASGTFAGGQNTATTDANGVATAPTFTANATAGSYTVSAATGNLSTTFSLTNTPGDASAVTVSSGSGQSTKINTAFANPLKALVKDAGGNPVAGVTVTFTPPSSGASGTFAGGQNTAVTDSNGIATSAVFTANSTSGANYLVTAAAAGVAQSAAFTLTNAAGDPASITVSSGAGQNAKVNATFGQPLKVLVKDAGGNPISGVNVTFTPPASGASLMFPVGQNVAATDSNGIAMSGVPVANGTVGSYNVVASVGNLNANFSMSNTAGDPASLTIISGSPQNVTVNNGFGSPLKVLVKDAGGNPIGGVTVAFTPPANGASGTFAGGQNTAVTDASGIATSAAFTANTTSGSYNVVASVGALNANFALTNNTGPAATLVVVDGSAQSTPKSTAFGKPLKAAVRDQYGNGIAGYNVTFTAPSSGASATFTNNQTSIVSVTDAAGVASSSVVTANSTPGPYNVSASANNLQTVSFLLTNTPGNIATLEISNGTSPQSTTVNSLFANVLKVLAKDVNGQPVQGATITFTVPPSGPSGTFLGGVTTATTDGFGVASSAPFSANCVAGGPYNVLATPSGVANVSVNFVMTNIQGGPANVQATSGSGQSAQVNNDFTNPLRALVLDSCGNALRAVNVTFAAPSSGPSATFSNGSSSMVATTDSSGVATINAKANGSVGGPYNVSASVAGLGQTASFALTNIPCTINCGGLITVTSANIGKNLQDSITVTLDPPAPNGLPLTVTPRDTSKVRVGNALPGLTTNLLAGTINLGVTVQALADSGQVQVDISAPNYATATATITLGPSGFVVAGPKGPNGIGEAFEVYKSSTTPLTVFAALLNAQGGVVKTQQVRVGNANLADNTSGPYAVKVPISVSVPSVAGLLPDPVPGQASPAQTLTVTLAGGLNSTTFNLKALDNGTTDVMVDSANAALVCSAEYLSAGKICPAPGFTTPTVGNKVQAAVKSSTLIPFSAIVGKNLQKAVRLGLTGPAPGSIQVTITSSDPSKVLFAAKSTDTGSASLTLNIGSGFASTPDFYVQAFNNAGSVPYSVSAILAGNNYGSTNGTVTLAPSGFAIDSPGGFGASSFTIQRSSSNANIGVYVGVISNGIMAESQLVAPGITIPVTVTSSDPSKGSITASPINIFGGSSSAVTAFTPLQNGATAITASSPGYQSAQVSANVVTGSLVISDGQVIGKNLEDNGGYVILPQPAGPGGVDVTVTSNSPFLRLSNSATALGTTSIVLTIPEGSTSANFTVQSFGNSGTATYTASTALYASKTSTVTLVPSAILIFPPSVSGSANGSTSATVFPVALNNGFTAQPLAGGSPLDVTVRTSNSAIVDVPAKVTIAAGTAGATVNITLKNPGQASVSIDQPAGFTDPAQYVSTIVTVNP